MFHLRQMRERKAALAAHRKPAKKHTKKEQRKLEKEV